MKLVTIEILALVALGLGCGSVAGPEDGRDDDFLADGKADAHGVAEGSPEAIGILAVVRTVSDEVLRNAPNDGVGLSDRAVDNLIDLRLGDDGRPGTQDDGTIDTLGELDAVPFIGPIAFGKLLAYARSHGFVDEPTTETCLRQVDCQGNADCLECQDGECADGDPIWHDDACVCMGDPSLACELAWCCPATQHWDAAACTAAGTYGDYCVPN